MTESTQSFSLINNSYIIYRKQNSIL